MVSSRGSETHLVLGRSDAPMGSASEPAAGDTTAPVYFVDRSVLAGAQAQQLVEIAGPDAHHAARVRRLREGQAVHVSDGAGTRATGAVHGEPNGDLLRIRLDTISVEASRSPRVIIVQALTKGDRGDRAIEMMAELGADVIIPFAAQRSVVRWTGAKIDAGRHRWQSIAREAAKQSRQAWVPDVQPLADIDDVCGVVRAADLALVLDVHGESAPAVPIWGDVVCVVGPEGGLSPAEWDAIRTAGAISASLGPTVLRAGTAGPVALTCILSQTLRWAPRSSVSVQGLRP